MNNIISEHINECFDSYDFFGSNGKEKIHNSIKTKYPDISSEEIKEIEEYLDLFYICCVEYADILAEKYKTPFLPKGEEAQKEISKYVYECQKKYPIIDEKHITGIFSTVCWLANR